MKRIIAALALLMVLPLLAQAGTTNAFGVSISIINVTTTTLSPQTSCENFCSSQGYDSGTCGPTCTDGDVFTYAQNCQECCCTPIRTISSPQLLVYNTGVNAYVPVATIPRQGECGTGEQLVGGTCVRVNLKTGEIEGYGSLDVFGPGSGLPLIVSTLTSLVVVLARTVK